MRGEYSTKQREVILSFLKENNAHVSASDIIFHLREQGYSVSTATVYRTLDKFESEGNDGGGWHRCLLSVCKRQRL